MLRSSVAIAAFCWMFLYLTAGVFAQEPSHDSNNEFDSSLDPKDVLVISSNNSHSFGSGLLCSLLAGESRNFVVNPSEYEMDSFDLVIGDGDMWSQTIVPHLRSYLNGGGNLLLTAGTPFFICGGTNLTEIRDIIGATGYENGGGEIRSTVNHPYGLPFLANTSLGSNPYYCSSAGITNPVDSLEFKFTEARGCWGGSPLYSYLYRPYGGTYLYVSGGIDGPNRFSVLTSAVTYVLNQYSGGGDDDGSTIKILSLIDYDTSLFRTTFLGELGLDSSFEVTMNPFSYSLSDYSAVVLDGNVMGPEMIPLLREYVNSGGVLAMLSGSPMYLCGGSDLTLASDLLGVRTYANGGGDIIPTATNSYGDDRFVSGQSLGYNPANCSNGGVTDVQDSLGFKILFSLGCQTAAPLHSYLHEYGAGTVFYMSGVALIDNSMIMGAAFRYLFQPGDSTSPVDSATTCFADGFNSAALESEWTQTAGSTSNLSTASGQLIVTNTQGGSFLGPWRRCILERQFRASADFEAELFLRYNRTTYKLFDINLIDSLNASVTWIRIWDSPSKWILMNRAEGKELCYQETQTSYEPSAIRISRRNGVMSVYCDGVLWWQCQVTETVTALRLTFADYLESMTPIIVDSVWACAETDTTKLETEVVGTPLPHAPNITMRILMNLGSEIGAIDQLDTSSILVNETLKPLSFAVISDRPEQVGSDLLMSFRIRDFSNTLPMPWSQATQTFTVRGQTSNGRPFEAKGEVAFLLPIVGDVDGNGLLDQRDLMLLFRYVLGEDVGIDPEASDLNMDGVVDLTDMSKLALLILGTETNISAN